MKRFGLAFGKWVARIAGLAVALALLPYLSRFLNTIMPDLTGAAIQTSITLSEKLSASARLETNQVDVEGVLSSTTDALLIGTVQRVQIAYTYHASIGIDLSKVRASAHGTTVTLELPEMEIISDSLTPTAVSRDDFWYPLTDERRQKLLDDEREAKAEEYLAGMNASDEAWQNTIAALDTTVAEWMRLGNSRVQIVYLKPGEAAP